MEKTKKRFNKFLVSFRVGWFLAVRQIKRSNKATTALIIFVMMLTFLNLVVVRGVLVGLIEGTVKVYDQYLTGQVFVSNLPKKSYIENSPAVLQKIEALPWVVSYSPRYIEGGSVEAGYKSKIRLTDASNSANGAVAGIDPLL